MKKLESIPNLLYDSTLVIQVTKMPQYKIKFSEIEQLRAKYLKQVVTEQQTTADKYRINPNKPFKFDTIAFLHKFYMWKGI